MGNWVLGIIGGSGLYDLQGLEDKSSEKMPTPWSERHVKLIRGELSGIPVIFLSRHGEGHKTPPSKVNYRANIDALKRAGATDIVSVSACGSLKEDMAPGDFVMVDQFIDRTFAREKSFFGEGLVAHASMAEPVCDRLAGFVANAAEPIQRKADLKLHRGGTYIAMEGPQFSTKAESHLYRSWGADVIGMTNMPEAKLAREAELPYATLAMVTDYDCWREDEPHVEVTNVLEVMQANTLRARQVLEALCADLSELKRTASPQKIETCLDHAIITAPEARDEKLIKKLDAVAGRALKA